MTAWDKKLLTAAVVLSALTGQVYAAETEHTEMAADEELPTYSLGEVVVTATRKKDRINEVPANITVITAKELEKRNVFSIREALTREAGIYISPTADVKNGVSLRGYSGSDLLVMYNGQPLNDSFDGAVNWDSIPLESVERIEIVRGAASSLYGGHAVAGVINIISKKAEKNGIHGSASLSYGSNNTWKRGLQVTGGQGRLSFRAGYEKRTTDGWAGYFKSNKATAAGPITAAGTLPRLSNGTYIVGSRGAKKKENENTSIDLNYEFDANRSLSYSYMHNSYRYSYHDPFSYLRGADGSQVFSGTVLTPSGRVKAQPSDFLGYVGQRAQDIHKVRYEDTTNEFKVGFGYSDTYKNGYSSASSAATSVAWTGKGELTEYPNQNYNLDMQKQWKIGQNSLLAGLSWMKDKMRYRGYDLRHWKDWGSVMGSATKQSGGSIISSALFVQDELSLDDRWKLNLGLRYDRVEKKDGYSVIGALRRDYEEKTFQAWSPKISVSYAPQKDMMVYASFGKSFNPPSIYKLYRRAGNAMSQVQANPYLTPETSKTYEIGIKQSIDAKTSYGLTFFRIDTHDKIALATRGGVKAYYNMDEAMTKGAELEIRHRINRDWRTYLTYTFESGELTNKGVTVRNWDLPKHMIRFGVDYTHKKFNGILDAQYVSARQSVDSATGEYGAEDSFFLTNLYLNYKLDERTKIQFGVENLFNRKFYAGEATNERAYSLGVNYSF